jgi:hypothetical protein
MDQDNRRVCMVLSNKGLRERRHYKLHSTFQQ